MNNFFHLTLIYNFFNISLLFLVNLTPDYTVANKVVLYSYFVLHHPIFTYQNVDEKSVFIKPTSRKILTSLLDEFCLVKSCDMSPLSLVVPICPFLHLWLFCFLSFKLCDILLLGIFLIISFSLSHSRKMTINYYAKIKFYISTFHIPLISFSPVWLLTLWSTI